VVELLLVRGARLLCRGFGGVAGQRGAVSDEFTDAVVAGWLAARERGESA
jgi:hypothetical protein